MSWTDWQQTSQAVTRLARPYRRTFVWIGLFAILGTTSDLVEPLIYREAVNDVAGLFVRSAYREGQRPDHPNADTSRRHRRGHVAARTPAQALRTLLGAVALLLLTSLVARAFRSAADNRSALAASRVEEDLITRTFDHVLRLPLAFFGKRSGGTLAKRIDQSDQVAPIVTAFTQEVAPEALRLIGIVAIMLTQSVELTLAALATLPVYLWTARMSARKLEGNIAQYYDLWEDISARIQDALGAVKTVKLSGAEPREVGLLSKSARAAYDTYLARNRLENRYLNVQTFLIQFGKAVVLGYGGYKVLEHQLTPGDVVMFVAYLDKVYDPIDSLTSLAANLQQQSASVARAVQLLGAGAEEAAGQPMPEGPGRVELVDVHFGYVPEREVLRGLTITLEPGKVTALVGPSGAGKTTTVDLLLRLYEPSAGQIRIDGVPLAQLDPSAVRREVGVVAADGSVFRGTLADNIRYKRIEATDDEVRAAAVAAGMARTLERLPEGLATPIGDKGMGLSVGERQRLQIARVLLSRPRILILDEATANLDYATEVEVKDALAEMRQGRTTLVIAHRFSMVRDADRVYVLDAGVVAEEGTPAELIAAGGWFAELAGSSGEDEEDESEGAEEDESEGAEEDDDDDDDDAP